MAPLSWTSLADGLRFPEGPVALPDGRVVVTELARGAISAVAPDGSRTTVVEGLPGPNGAAPAPGGGLHLVDNGAWFRFHEAGDLLLPDDSEATGAAGSYRHLDLVTGDVSILAEASDRGPLVAPNDLVLDADGGAWFTDYAAPPEGDGARPGLCYRHPDGRVVGVVTGTEHANGVGLSPDGDIVYLAETMAGRLWSWTVTGPGTVALDPGSPAAHGGTLRYDAPDGHLFDSLAVDGEGVVCVATIGPGAISCVPPDGSAVELVEVPGDALVTNICFGGADARTAFVTASGTGRLLSARWPRPGLLPRFTDQV